MATRTITVKGIGRVSASPDYVEISMEIVSRDMKYDKAMKKACKNIQQLNASLETIGFEKNAIKTTNFDVRTLYDNVKKADGNYQREFKGYCVEHSLKICFALDMEKLSQVLTALSDCAAEPLLQIRFTVKDATSLTEELLRNATKNAHRKAEVMCEASGVRIGMLLSMSYNWSELDIYSDTQYKCLEGEREYCAAERIDITPDDINISDTVTFIWEIEEAKQ